jgi:Family of unknown function (DUF6353)
MGFKLAINRMYMKVTKHSPAIFTAAGVVGLGATAWFAYKSRDKVEAIVEDIEEKRANKEEINKMEVARDIAEAIYIPVVIGAMSAACILLSHRIQNKRITALAGAFAAQQARNFHFEKKYRKEYGDEAYEEFSAPKEKEEIITEDKNGKPKVTVTEIKKDIDQTIGQWYDESSEYASDDHTYNAQYINSVRDRMHTVLFQRGHLLLNEVRQALGFERIRAGALLGWSVGDGFDIEKVVTTLGDPDSGELKEQIWVTWTRPKYIYDAIEFNSRYSVY